MTVNGYFLSQPLKIMPATPGKVCLICGFDNCATSAKSFAEHEFVSGAEQSQQVQTAANLLAKSQITLICGIDCLPLDAQMSAWKLADQTRSIIDLSLTTDNRAAIQSLQRHGKVSATYGEIANRSDRIVFWDCDLEHQPCLLQMLTDKPVTGRKVVFVGDADSPMAKLADRVFAVNMTKDRNAMVRLICRLRAKVLGKNLHDDQFNQTDLSASQVQQLFDLLASASYSSLFFSSRETDGEFDFETESLLRFVTEFNSIGPLVGMKVRDDQNGLGAETVLTLASGFPSAISLRRGYAESTGTIYSAAEVLRRSACDTVLLFGNTNINGSSIPSWIQDELERLTVIQISDQQEPLADVYIACPVVQVGQPFVGKVLRGDGVMLSCSAANVGSSAESILEFLTNAYQSAVEKI